MKTHVKPRILQTAALAAAVAGLLSTSQASTLTNGLAGYWPLDNITGCSLDRTPDLVHGYDLQLYQVNTHTNFPGESQFIYLTNGVRGNAMFFGTSPNLVLAFQSVVPSSFAPVNRYSPSNNAVSFWIKTDPNQPPPNNDHRIWCESDFVRTYASVFDISANGSVLDVFMRQTPDAAGLATYGNFSGGAHFSTTLTACDNTWHNVTLVAATNGAAAGTNTCVYYLYIDGVLDPSSGPAVAGSPWPNKNDGQWKLDSVALGALYRSGSAGFLTNCFVDEFAEWDRALDTNEIAEYITIGITNTFPPVSPLTLQSYSANVQEVPLGSSLTLNWVVSSDATGISIDNGVGSVLANTTCGIGSVAVTPKGQETYTLTLTRGAEAPQTATVTVKTISYPNSGWSVLDDFNTDNLGLLGGQLTWQVLVASPQVPACAPIVVSNTVTGNRVALTPGQPGGPGQLGAINLPTPLSTGVSNTIFYRFYLDPAVQTSSGGIIPDIDLNIGLSDKLLRDPNDFVTTDNGPALRIFRSNFGGGGPIDLTANFGAQQTGGFSWVSSIDPAGLQTGVVYTVWMDVYKTNNSAVANVSSYYSVTVSTNADGSSPFALFSNQISDRGTNSGALSELFLAVNPGVTPQGTNVVILDDFYQSSNGAYLHTLPDAAGSFVVSDPTPSAPPITITHIGKTGSTVSATWSSTAGSSYRIVSTSSINGGGVWNVVQTGIPSAGATTSTSFSDATTTGTQTFYRVISP